MIDGLDDNERYIGSVVVKPPIDALAEFKLSTNAYAAELGRTAGASSTLSRSPEPTLFMDRKILSLVQHSGVEAGLSHRLAS